MWACGRCLQGQHRDSAGALILLSRILLSGEMLEDCIPVNEAGFPEFVDGLHEVAGESKLAPELSQLAYNGRAPSLCFDRVRKGN